MSKILGVLTFVGVTSLGFLWFWGVLYNWLWLGLVNAGSTGWIIVFGLLFFIFLICTIPVIVLLAIGFAIAFIIGSE
jgi:hypothetical protein